MKNIMILTLALLFALPLMAEWELPRPDFNPWRESGSSLLNPDRLAMSHSMGFSAGTSSSGNGYYLSRYTNHLRYQFNPKLDLALDLNLVNFGSTSSNFTFNKDNASKVIPEFRLNYRPTDGVNISFEFAQGYPWQTSRSPWYDRW